MSIFGTLFNNEETVIESYSGYIEPSLEGIMGVNSETALEFYQVNASMYIFDVVAEEAIIENSANPSVLLESFLKDKMGKLKEIFQNLAAKVRSWFEAAIKFLKRIFLSGEKFVKEFQNEIKQKSVKGFEYTGYKITLDEGENESKKVLSDLKKTLDEKVEVAETIFENIDSLNEEEKLNVKEEKEDILQKIGVKDVNSMVKQLRLAYRGGSDKEETIKDMSANSKEELITIFLSGKEKIKEVEKEKAENERMFGRILTALNRSESFVNGLKSEELTESGKAKIISLLNARYQIVQYVLSLQNTIYGVMVEETKSALKLSEKVLRSFVAFKPSNKSSDEKSGVKESSILESLMKYV